MSSSAQRALSVLKALRGHSLSGLSNGQLATHLNETPTNITRALQDLAAADLVQKLDNGNFAHTPLMEQIALAHLNSLNQAEQRIKELQRRAAVHAG
ncbi:helix-turn-helix domain-containing protein [Agitococcus lubricus]|uniref:HTH iclR-type domain-containing protein n=1 Tax=Agitococcus lubricus TaxID=1077255 RepID=A0A2T5J3Q4_9GAMM|nr:helix-turn-helix domain-containing protein [Agitococcus lubricus]PTQ91249.1 hypothetical protein C8N29_101322 [Agitococcus lubricus]